MKIELRSAKCEEKHRGSVRGAMATAVVLSLVAGRGGPVEAAEVQVLRIDGTSLTGEWLGSDGQGAIRVRSEAGEAQFVVEELSSVRFAAAGVAPVGTATVHLADGGKLLGELVGGEGEAIEVGTSIGTLRIPFKALAGIRLVQGEEHARSAELFDSAMDGRLPGYDVLVTRGPEEVKALRGRLEALNAEQGSFIFSDRSRTFQNEKLYGLVFAAGVAKSPTGTVMVELADGSSFSGELEGADADTLRVKASFGSTVRMDLHNVLRLLVRSSWVTYMSDLTPATESVEGLLHQPWPVRKDRSASAGPLSMSGRAFDRGLGVHSRTELTYDLGGEYEAFVATIGIDDAVRPRGSVVFRISGDGRELFDSGEVRGSQEPRDVRVDVAGVKSLTLLVDYGEGLDVSDHADWGGARLLRPGGGAKKSGEAQ